MSITTNTEPQGELLAAGEALLAAAMDYWETYRRSGLVGAVVWLKDSDGRMVVLTRGEYQSQLMRNIDDVVCGEVINFGGEVS